MDYTTFKLENFQFQRRRSAYGRLNGWLGRALRYLAGRPPLLGVTLKEGGRVKDVHIGEAIGFDSQEMIEILKYHDKRYRKHDVLSAITAFVTYMALLSLMLKPVGSAFAYLRGEPIRIGQQFGSTAITRFIWVMASVFLFYTLLFFFQATLLRIYDFLVTRFYAESLCIHTVLNVILNLSRDDVLTYPHKKKELLSRVRYLSKMTTLLEWRFGSKSELVRGWTAQHFKHMEKYLREREKWIIAPRASTLSDLRDDFYELARVYITGHFGEFAWPASDTAAEPSRVKWYQPVFGTVLRLVGMVLPLVLMGMYIWNPARFPFVKIDTNIVTFIFIGWLLLALDTLLKLGVVTQLIGIAKGIKELK